MKNKKDERERFLFRVISRLSRRSVGAKGDVSWATILSLMAWIFVAGQIAFAESFTNWPTAGEMDEIVRLGTECVLGVNERCWATQYSTNPVQYRVAPFTNSSEFYLDQNLMGAMASKIRALVPYYADRDTVYDNTTNIVMLTVTGVWAKLTIGNRTNKFTQAFASGTNVAVYGDLPWRIYKGHLWERWDVLSVCHVLKAGIIYDQNPVRVRTALGSDYFELANNWGASSWQVSGGDISFGVRIDKSLSGDSWGFQRAAFIASNLYFVVNTNLMYGFAKIFGKTIQPFGSFGVPIGGFKYYDEDFDPTITSPSFVLITEFPVDINFMPSLTRGFVDSIFSGAVAENGYAKGMNVLAGSMNVYIRWIFRYCRWLSVK